MLTAIQTQKLRERIEALDDEALIEETMRLRDSAKGVPQKILDKWDADIAEAVQRIESIRTIGRRKEARGRLRSFCLERSRHSCREGR